ncbi:MAG: lipase, partial [Clostridia bacterium]|nr:lipase [Clostridia bacterium]
MANNYPFVLIHGYNNMTDTFGPAREILTEAGYECYSPHIGPFTGLWDRACELYAMLKGGTVDYGIAHSERCGHPRYGKTFEGMFKNWGELDENGEKVKAHFVGHSFGGATIRFLLHLLIEGDEREKAVTPADELHPLFQGGHDDWIETVFTVAAPHNGTTVLTMAGG